EAVFRSAADLLARVRDWAARGIVLHFAEFPIGTGGRRVPISISGDMGRLVVGVLEGVASISRTTRSEAIAEGLRARRAKGFRYTNCPGYGHKWVGRRGRQTRAVDEYEWATIEHIISLRHSGHSWSAIALHLMRRRILTPAGEVWSASR